MWKKNKGFTLIELLLVLAIIGFLVAIIVPSVGNYGAEAKEKAVKSDLQTLKAAIEMYRVEKGVFPTSGALEAELQGVSNRLVDNVPVDPYKPSVDYTYVLAVAGTTAGGKDTYVVYSAGKGGDGTCASQNVDTCTHVDGTGGYHPICFTNAKAGCGSGT